MPSHIYRSVALLILAACVGRASVLAEGPGMIHQDAERKVVTLADGQGHLALRLNYDGRCVVDRVTVRGRDVAAKSGVASGIRVGGQWSTTRTGIPTPDIAVRGTTLTVSNIAFGKPEAGVRETWKFTVKSDRIIWRISRRYLNGATLEDTAFPEWDFAEMSTWTGGLLGNGGVVWNKYLETANATYGAHTGSVTFWNRQANDCLRIVPMVPKGQHGASRFTHQPDGDGRNGVFTFNYSVSGEELKTAHKFYRWLSDRQDVWAPFAVKPGTVNVELSLQALDYKETYNRGTFKGLDGGSIRELVHTVGRYGVIDNRLVGANGWRTGNICLHEPFFGQIGFAVDDPDYTANLASTLDYERDYAILKDGRVKSRWTYDDFDSIPGSFDDQGFYEAQWGYLMDSQPDYVIVVAEQFDMSGDRKWLAGQKAACEKALDYMLRREAGGSGLVTMMTDSHLQKRGSDWIDIIWASYKNALVNAEMYYALNLWAKAEDTLGDAAKAAEYRAFAARLKAGFNKPISEGGFWDPGNKWYVYWLDKDGSAHGNNLCTPVNFAAIAYGICDEPARQKAILDRTEAETAREKLFMWPLNVFPYQTDEGMRRNFPFPNYENGSIFMSWAELGIRAYADYDPALALKYVKQTLARYEQDGLSYQHYERARQNGNGDDILAGNCMAIVGLYRDIYGVQPQPNRLYLDPHLTPELDGTQLRYGLRGRQYVIDLATTGCALTAEGVTVRATVPFGLNATGAGVEFSTGASAEPGLSVARPRTGTLTVQIESWPDDPAAPRSWTEVGSPSKVGHVVTHLRANADYELTVNGGKTATLRADTAGRVKFSPAGDAATRRFDLKPRGTNARA
jgi:hypothetical protein